MKNRQFLYAALMLLSVAGRTAVAEQLHTPLHRVLCAS